MVDLRREALINKRQQRSWKQGDVVDELKQQFGLEISESYYGMIEQGVRTPNLQLGISIAELFSVDAREIFFGQQPNS
ncbi:helix-turn-helix transcriptional regulator [Tumebacillus permanentifrigoris]|uniref:helix-turn-helix transcriptional regulator n=1 Tax=Tumebacillus permanentifrigoris TaxID=378543 RepID=UPI003CCC5F30